MQPSDFEKLKAHILDKNTYFSKGFANAYKDDTSGAIWVNAGSNKICLLPADTLGNYCYLRNDLSMKHFAQDAERLTDSGTQRLTFLDTITISLVAIVKNAEPFQLIENLKNTCMSFEGLNAQPISSNWNREQVLTEELSGMKADDIQAALQRLKNETIVKLVLNFSKTFIPANCIINPIKP